MKPPPFSYARPGSVERALEILADHDGAARVLAGGQSLLPLLNFRLAAPEVLVDITRIEVLRQVTETEGGFRLGAAVTQRRVETSGEMTRRLPVLSRTMRLIGHVQNRNRGTIGGSIAHADPAAELPALCVALDAEILARSPAGLRSIPAADFFVGPYETSLEPTELLEAVWFHDAGGARTSIHELSPRHGDFAVAGVVGKLDVDQGTVTEAGLALFGVATTPVRLSSVEHALVGNPIDPDAIDAAVTLAREAASTGYGDVHASSDYRARVAAELTRRALVEMAA